MCEVCAYGESIDVADGIINMSNQIDEENHSQSAISFADSVREKAIGMKEWMEDKEHVTEKMRSALDNMSSGAERWLDGGNPF